MHDEKELKAQRALAVGIEPTTVYYSSLMAEQVKRVIPLKRYLYIQRRSVFLFCLIIRYKQGTENIKYS